MSERDAFLAAIYTNPADDTPRLVYADWLDDHDEHDRAAFTRCPHLIRHKRVAYGRWEWRWQKRCSDSDFWVCGVPGLWPAAELFTLPASFRGRISEYTFRHGFVTSVLMTLETGCKSERSYRTLRQIGTLCPAVEMVHLERAIHPRERGGGDDWNAVYRYQLGPLWDILCPDSDPEDVFAERKDYEELAIPLAIAAARYARYGRRPSETVP